MSFFWPSCMHAFSFFIIFCPPPPPYFRENFLSWYSIWHSVIRFTAVFIGCFVLEIVFFSSKNVLFTLLLYFFLFFYDSLFLSMWPSLESQWDSSVFSCSWQQLSPKRLLVLSTQIDPLLLNCWIFLYPMIIPLFVYMLEMMLHLFYSWNVSFRNYRGLCAVFVLEQSPFGGPKPAGGTAPSSQPNTSVSRAPPSLRGLPCQLSSVPPHRLWHQRPQLMGICSPASTSSS